MGGERAILAPGTLKIALRAAGKFAAYRELSSALDGQS
jgi:hypothetical protein